MHVVKSLRECKSTALIKALSLSRIYLVLHLHGLVSSLLFASFIIFLMRKFSLPHIFISCLWQTKILSIFLIFLPYYFLSFIYIFPLVLIHIYMHIRIYIQVFPSCVFHSCIDHSFRILISLRTAVASEQK